MLFCTTRACVACPVHLPMQHLMQLHPPRAGPLQSISSSNPTAHPTAAILNRTQLPALPIPERLQPIRTEEEVREYALNNLNCHRKGRFGRKIPTSNLLIWTKVCSEWGGDGRAPERKGVRGDVGTVEETADVSFILRAPRYSIVIDCWQ